MCAHYQVRLDNAHNSADDAVAAARLAWRLAKTEPERLGLVDPHVLHSHRARWYRDREFAYVASRHGRSPRAIRSRLLRLRCDPELPGQTCDEHRAAHLKQIHDAEYGRN